MDRSIGVPRRTTLRVVALLAGVAGLLFGMSVPGMVRQNLTFEGEAHARFGSNEGLAAIRRLFAQLERETPADLESVPDGMLHSRDPGFARFRLLPPAKIPEMFRDLGFTDSSTSAKAGIPAAYAVCDQQDRLIGLYFDLSRYGCFVSRQRNLCPAGRGAYYRLLEKDVTVTIFTTDGPFGRP